MPRTSNTLAETRFLFFCRRRKRRAATLYETPILADQKRGGNPLLFGQRHRRLGAQDHQCGGQCVGLSAPAVAERLARLEERRAIADYATGQHVALEEAQRVVEDAETFVAAAGAALARIED